MQIVINGQAREFPNGTALTAVLRELGTQGPMAVELNGAVLPRSQHEHTTLKEGDRLEVVTFVGGG